MSNRCESFLANKGNTSLLCVNLSLASISPILMSIASFDFVLIALYIQALFAIYIYIYIYLVWKIQNMKYNFYLRIGSLIIFSTKIVNGSLVCFRINDLIDIEKFANFAIYMSLG